ncbi:MAG: hypothetical protein AAGM46_26340 [Cyanobacteria bacterium J06582_2]
MQRVWLLREELDLFLEELNTDDARSYLDLLRDEKKVADMAFLVDILSHLNILNLKLQGMCA